MPDAPDGIKYQLVEAWVNQNTLLYLLSHFDSYPLFQSIFSLCITMQAPLRHQVPVPCRLSLQVGVHLRLRHHHGLLGVLWTEIQLMSQRLVWARYPCHREVLQPHLVLQVVSILLYIVELVFTGSYSRTSDTANQPGDSSCEIASSFGQQSSAASRSMWCNSSSKWNWHCAKR